jgi:hypothetical protein
MKRVGARGWLIAASLLITFSGCGEDTAADAGSRPADLGDRGRQTPDDAADDAGGGDDASLEGDGASDASDTSAADAELDLPMVSSSCDEAALASCTTNYDCPDTARCQDVSAGATEIPCCVEAPRGTLPAGQPCSDENDCLSGLCISRGGPMLCTDRCDSVDECPDNMPECGALFVAAGRWCLPPG